MSRPQSHSHSDDDGGGGGGTTQVRSGEQPTKHRGHTRRRREHSASSSSDDNNGVAAHTSEKRRRKRAAPADTSCCYRLGMCANTCYTLTAAVFFGLLTTILAMGATPPIMRLVLRSRRTGVLALYAIAVVVVFFWLTRWALHMCMRYQRGRAIGRAAR